MKNKNKFFTTALMAVMALSIMVGCSKKENTTSISSNNNNQSTTSKNSAEASTSKPNYEKADYLTSSYEEPEFDFVIDVPAYQSFREGSSQLWNMDGQFFIIAGIADDTSMESYKYKLEDIKKVEDIAPALKKQAIVSSSRKSYTTLRDLIVTKNEVLEINSREVCRFTGYFDCDSADGSIKDRLVVGYTTFYKDRPMYIIGSVSSNGQEQKYIDEVTKNVDDIVKTLRDAE